MPRVESQVEWDRTDAKPGGEHGRPKAMKVLGHPGNDFIVHSEHVT